MLDAYPDDKRLAGQPGMAVQHGVGGQLGGATGVTSSAIGQPSSSTRRSARTTPIWSGDARVGDPGSAECEFPERRPLASLRHRQSGSGAVQADDPECAIRQAPDELARDPAPGPAVLPSPPTARRANVVLSYLCGTHAAKDRALASPQPITARYPLTAYKLAVSNAAWTLRNRT